jgi:(p)ppGpp synthase/HD superfamily hydrolase
VILDIVRQVASRGGRTAQIEAAMFLVLHAFRGQSRYATECPAAAHSIRVGLRLEAFTDPAETVLIGLLHDVLEDTSVGADFIREVFGDEVLRGVEACSHDEELYKRDVMAGNLLLLTKARAFGPPAIKAKMSDINDNLVTYFAVPESWRAELLWCGREWLRLGREVLGEDAPHCKGLANIISKIENRMNAVAVVQNF